MTDHRAALTILIDLAPALRRAGVESFSIDDLGALRDVRLRPADIAMPESKGADPHEATHPLDDPDTFGGALPVRPSMFGDDIDEEQQS